MPLVRYGALVRDGAVAGFTWSCSTWQPSASSVVTVTLEPHGDEQTLMTIQHAQLPPGVLDDHQNGWLLISEQLEDWLTRDPLP